MEENGVWQPAKIAAFLPGMFYLESIRLWQYRNYREKRFDFTARIVGICGPNGVGKTNLLDAIYYLCFTKSYFLGSDGALVHQGFDGFRLEGCFATESGGLRRVTAVYRGVGRKEISWQGEVYPRVSAHIGRLPAVMIAPDDIRIITGGSEERRKMTDALLCQMDATYLQQLMRYNKLLQQRNSLLRQYDGHPGASLSVMDVLDAQLAQAGAYVYEQRFAHLQPYLLRAIQHYRQIAGGNENLEASYQSVLNQLSPTKTPESALLQLLQNNRSRDLAAQRTTTGLHRDDLVFTLQNQPFKQVASQGQRKSLLFALKLTEYEMLQEQKGFAPLLLLDDVFEKLDGLRMQNLLKKVCLEKQGQVFITDTHPDRLSETLDALDTKYGLVYLDT